MNNLEGRDHILLLSLYIYIFSSSCVSREPWLAQALILGHCPSPYFSGQQSSSYSSYRRCREASEPQSFYFHLVSFILYLWTHSSIFNAESSFLHSSSFSNYFSVTLVRKNSSPFLYFLHFLCRFSIVFSSFFYSPCFSFLLLSYLESKIARIIVVRKVQGSIGIFSFNMKFLIISKTTGLKPTPEFPRMSPATLFSSD